MKQFEVFELQFEGPAPRESNVTVNFSAEFIHEQERVKVLGFYAGNGSYRIRFYPKQAGIYHWKTEGIISEKGEEYCEEADGKSGGMVVRDGLHFRYESGDKYLPFGTTVYALLHQPKELIEQTFITLSEAPFNKIRFCIFPKYFYYNREEPEQFPYFQKDGRWDMHHPDYAFWDQLDSAIERMNEMGIQADIIFFHPYDKWGFSKLTKEECDLYLEYAVRRLAAHPNVWWSLSNEYDTIPAFELAWWPQFAAQIRDLDPYGHLLSNHNCLVYWDFANEDTTHCCIQDSNVQYVSDYQAQFGKPVIFDECGYEGNLSFPWGNLSAFEMVNRFWMAVSCGGYCSHGETYLSEDDVLWWSKGGALKGKSPERIGFLKEIVESFPEALEYLPEPENQDEKFMALKEHPEKVDAIPGFAKGLVMKPYERILSFVDGGRKYQGHCGEEVYLFYFARQCMAYGEVELPNDRNYRIEVINVWDMTRETVLEQASGKVKVPLPGIEGMAVLATVI